MPTEVIAEHRMYLPLCAVIALVVLGVYLLIRANRIAVMAAAILLVMTSGALAVATFHRNESYRSMLAFWSDISAKQPTNIEAHAVLGTLLIRAGQTEAGFGQFDDELNSSNDKISVHRIIAEEVMRYRMWSLAQQHLRDAVTLGANDPTIFNNLAWLEATNPDASMRDGPQAVGHALRAIQLSGNRSANFLGTLAAAYAEEGDYDLAAATQDQAIHAAQAAGQSSVIQTLTATAALYRSARPYRELPDAPPAR
jgi:tetratricopeptide (TPR) repeat protein